MGFAERTQHHIYMQIKRLTKYFATVIVIYYLLPRSDFYTRCNVLFIIFIHKNLLFIYVILKPQIYLFLLSLPINDKCFPSILGVLILDFGKIGNRSND